MGPARGDWDWSGARQVCLRETRRVLRDPRDAEDAAQDALLRAWRSRASCATPERPHGWMAAIARNVALSAAAARSRRDGREVAVPDIEAAPAAHGSPVEADAVARATIGQALRGLGAPDRMLLALRYDRDLTYAEIARRVASPQGTVKVRLHRLRRRLREELQ
jgi:RNA polymerase sigma-70 factor (ECF subfamily)